MRIFLIFLIALFPLASYADSPRDAFTRLRACVRDRNADGCRTGLTHDSLSLYDRFASYGLMNCLPQDATYVSEQPAGDRVLVRAAATPAGETKRYLRLAFAQESGGWKLDIPDSLRRSMGKNWENQVLLTEQLYLYVRKQTGKPLGCDTVRALVEK